MSKENNRVVYTDILFRAKSLIDVNEMNARGIDHRNGIVYGSYLDEYMLSGVIEANSYYIAIEQWCPVDKDTLEVFTGKLNADGEKIFTDWKYAFA